jgi:hypothetical protein
MAKTRDNRKHRIEILAFLTLPCTQKTTQRKKMQFQLNLRLSKVRTSIIVKISHSIILKMCVCVCTGLEKVVDAGRFHLLSS